MVVWLNVAEKPSVAKEVSSILSHGQCRTTQSLSRFNPVFEFRLGAVDMLFTSVAGHMTEDEFPANTKSWANFPLQQLFTVPITRVVKEEFQGAKKNLEQLAKRSTHIVLWLDCDREGENICFEVLDVVLAANRRLDVKRAHFSALTQRDLVYAVAHLTAPNKHLSDAVEARREMDLRIGAVFTRMQTIKFRERFENMPRILSFGPCQFPTLGFVVKRFWERTAFVPEDFYYAVMQHEQTHLTWEHGNVHDAQCAAALLEDTIGVAEEEARTRGTGGDASLGDADQPTPLEAVVTRVAQKPSHRYPPVPLCTVELQKLASTHLRMSAEQCMSVAEGLYQQGFLSYPRTETDEYSFTDDELVDFAAIQVDNPDVADFAQRIVQDRANRFRRPKSGGHNDHAHPPIHPIRLMPGGGGGGGGGQPQAVYELVVRHFLAAMSPPAVAAATHVDVTLGGTVFHTSGQTVVDRGWLDVFKYERWGNSTVPNYQEGQRFVPTEVSLRSGRTEAPSLLNEAQLISVMDKEGIGTDATIAQHIKTVLDREYVTREGGVLKPTPLGIALASAYEAAGLKELIQPTLRAQMEMAMGDIARGVATKEQVLAAAVTMYRDVLVKLTSRLHVFEEELTKHLRPVGGGAAGGGAAGGEAAELRLVAAQSNFSRCGRCGGMAELVVGTAADANAPQRGFLRCNACGPPLLRVPMHPSVQLAAHAQQCPLCGFGVLSVTNTERHTSYTLCPWCFTHPPAGAMADVESIGEFRCFQCTAACPLAKGVEQLSIAKCPVCPEHLRLRTFPNGNRSLSCKGKQCTFTVSLPSAEDVVPAQQQRCDACGAMLLTFRFGLAHMIPGVDREETVCVACDGRLKDYLVVRGGAAGGGGGGSVPSAAVAGVGPPQPYVMPTVAPTRGGRGGATRGGGGRGRGRGARGGGSAGGAGAGAVMCECGISAKRLTSRQEASAGREFLTCGNNRTCGFFQWIE